MSNSLTSNEILAQIEAYASPGFHETAATDAEKNQLVSVLLGHIRRQDAKYSKLVELLDGYLDKLQEENKEETICDEPNAPKKN